MNKDRRKRIQEVADKIDSLKGKLRTSFQKKRSTETIFPRICRTVSAMIQQKRLATICKVQLIALKKHFHLWKRRRIRRILE